MPHYIATVLHTMPVKSVAKGTPVICSLAELDLARMGYCVPE
jgi:hypothetical protein